MRSGLILILLLLAAVTAAAQDTTPTPEPTLDFFSTLTPVVTPFSDARVDPRLVQNPIYLSGVGATPISRSVNIRSGPGLDYPVIGVLRVGQSIDVMGYNGYDLNRRCSANLEDDLDMWVQVQYRDARAWMARCALSITGDMTNMLVQTPPPK